jgi:hypothetical protein
MGWIVDVDDPQPRPEPGDVNETILVHVLAQLVGAKTEFAPVIGRCIVRHIISIEGLRLGRIGDVPGAKRRVRLLGIGPALRAFLFRRHGDGPAVDRKRHLEKGMSRFRPRRVVLVMTQGAGLANVGDVDDGDARGPAARIHLVAGTHGVMQAVLGPLRMRRLATPHILPVHPPARDFDRP